MPAERDQPRAEGPVSDLTRKSVRGGIVAIASQLLKFALQMSVMMMLARLLDPEDFGLQGMLASVTGFLFLFRNAGLGTVTVQRDDISDRQISNLFWANMAVGVFLALALIAMAPAMAEFFVEPRLTSIAVVSAGSFLLNALSVQHLALLQRKMRFVSLAIVEVTSLAISGAVGVAMSLAGCGYWSLVGMTIALPAATALGAWCALPWMPSLPKRDGELRSMVSLGGVLTFGSVVVYLAYNAEKFLLGHFFGATVLGIYGRAYQLVSLPTDQLTSALYSVALPSLSRLQNDPERLARAFFHCYTLVTSLTLPITITCAIFPEEIVHFVLGPKWTQAAPLLRLLSPTIFVFALINPLGWYLISSGRARRSMNMAFLIAPCVILAVLLGVRGGAEGVALAFSSVMVLLVVPLIAWTRAGTGIPMSSFWLAVRAPILAGMLSGLAGLVVAEAMLAQLPTLLRLLFGAGIVSVVYATLLLFVVGQKDVYAELYLQFFSKRSRASGPRRES